VVFLAFSSRYNAMRGKGQGASEYIATYSWAILIIVVAGIILWQFGVFNPSGGITAGVTGFTSVRPSDWKCDAESGDVEVRWVNGVGSRITVTSTDGGCIYKGVLHPDGMLINVSMGDTITCKYLDVDGCNDAIKGGRFESEVNLHWVPTEGGIAHTESGSVWKAAE
jgi:hypothetical protein